MHIKVSTRHTALTENDRGLVVEKIERLGAKFLDMDRADIHFFEERNPRIRDREVCEVTLEGHGHHVRCKAAGPDHLTAIDRAIEKLENKLHKLKTKLSTYRGHRDITRAKQWAQVSASVEPVMDGAPADSIVAASSASVQDAAAAGAPGGVAVSVEENATPRIVKIKTVERLVLHAVDAAERMDLVDHPFYFFTNVETGRAAVVYRREDGDIGLIDEGAE